MKPILIIDKLCQRCQKACKQRFKVVNCPIFVRKEPKHDKKEV